MKILKFDETVNLLVRKYPTLYWGMTNKSMQRKVSEHIFNVIGNGFNDLEGLQKLIDNKANRKILNDKSKDFLFEGISFYNIIDRNNIHGKDKLSLTNTDLSPNEIARLIKDKGCYIYPNFSKRYSFFYKMKEQHFLDYFDISWFEAMKEYYTVSKTLINGDAEYQCKPPSDLTSKEWEITKKDFLEAFDRYGNGKTGDDFNKEISKAYNHPYDGDLDKFLQTKWDKELNIINNFIDETLIEIEEQIRLKKKLAMKI